MASSTPLITGKESYWGALNLDESTVALMNKSETFRHYAADYETAVSKEGLRPITVGGDLADYFERGKGIHMGQDLQTLPSEVLIGLLSHELSHFENRASDAAFEKKYAVNPYDPNAFAMKAMTSMHAESEAALDNVKVAHEIDDATGGQSKIFVSGALMADKNHNRIDTGLQKAFDEQHAKDVQNHLTAEQDRNLMIASGMGVLSVVPTSADPETPAYMFYGDVNNAPRPEDGTVTHATLQDANGSGNISSMSQTWSSGHTVTQQFNGTKLASSSDTDGSGNLVSRVKYSDQPNGTYSAQTFDGRNQLLRQDDFAQDGSERALRFNPDGTQILTESPPPQKAGGSQTYSEPWMPPEPNDQPNNATSNQGDPQASQ